MEDFYEKQKARLENLWNSVKMRAQHQIRATGIRDKEVGVRDIGQDKVYTQSQDKKPV